MTETRVDDFLGGRVRIEQPARGYRAGADTVMLAAACPARPEQSVLELGCGVGTALLCLAARVPELSLTGVEREADFVRLAGANAERNHTSVQVIEADLTALPSDLRAMSFDHVILNPPFFAQGTPAPDDSRASARHEDTPLAIWIETALRRLRPGGYITVIHLASRLDGLLCGLSGQAGDIAILPVAARAGRDAGRIIVSARKGSRGSLRLLAPFIMHQAAHHSGDGEDLSQRAQAVLRHGAFLDLRGADYP